MKRKIIVGIGSVLLSMGLLSGCAKTPDNSLIKQKGDASLKNYEEGESLGAAKTEESDAAAGENAAGESGTSSENGAGEGGTSGENSTGGSGTSSGTSAGEGGTSGENSAGGSGTSSGTSVGEGGTSNGISAGEGGTSGENSIGGNGTSNGTNAGESAASDENSIGESDASGGNGADESGLPKEASGENKLRAALNAPEHYQSEVQDETGKLQILTDAEVEIPNATKVSAIAVSQHPFDQAVMDKVTETFFPNAVFYTSDDYYRLTKDDYQKKIELLKGYAAAGNLDPYGWGTDEDGNLFYDIYQDIEQMENAYEAAPETKELTEVHPQFGLEIQNPDGSTRIDDDWFYGVACTEDGKIYSYRIKSYGEFPQDITIERSHENVERVLLWGTYDMVKGTEKAPDEEDLKQKIGISYEEAKALADEKVAALGIPDMEMANWEYALQWSGDEENNRSELINEGYEFYYTRKINGIPITYTDSLGGAYEDMDSEMETWAYEVLNMVVNQDGIDMVEFINLYDMGEVKTENLNLLPFDEIIKIYEKMMLISNADVINYENYRHYHIDRITFGYSRIYEPSSDSRSGILIPVWDFFGSFDLESEYDGKIYTDTMNDSYLSFLTINAVDGSIIDRGLGY